MKEIKYFTYLLLILTGLPSVDCLAKTIDLGGTLFSYSSLEVGAGQTLMAACDFNSDGHQDVIAANSADDNIITFEGNGKGDLIEVGRFPAGENPVDIAVFDINNDGNLDIAIANHETEYVSLLSGDGKGRFRKTPQSPFNIGIKPHPHAVELKDLNGDKLPELIVDSRDNEGVLVLKGLPDGGFKKPGTVINVGGEPYRGFAVADFNDDGLLDLVTPNTREIGIATNTGSNNISFSVKTMAHSGSPFAVELAEMTGDGKMDLVVATNGSLITIMPGDGQGNFQEDKKTVIKTTSGGKQIATGDINGDGIKDALISIWSGKLLAVFGGKISIEAVTFENSSIPNPWGIALTDLNEDGKSDFIITDGESRNAAVYLSQ